MCCCAVQLCIRRGGARLLGRHQRCSHGSASIHVHVRALSHLGHPSWGVSCSWWPSTMGITLLSLSCVPASMFCAHPHPSMTTRGGARFEVGWAAHIHGGCPGRNFHRFGVQGGFCSFLVLVRICVRVDRQVVGTHSVGRCVQAVFTAFMALGGAH